MEMPIVIEITPEEYLQAEAKARKMRMPTDKAVGKIVSFHMPSILANTHVEAPAGPKPIDWGRSSEHLFRIYVFRFCSWYGIHDHRIHGGENLANTKKEGACPCSEHGQAPGGQISTSDRLYCSTQERSLTT